MMELAKVLARAFASVAVSIDLTDDDDIDPDVATEILEPVNALFRDLSPEDRRTLAAMLVELSGMETDPVRQASMAQLPDDMGLLD